MSETTEEKKEEKNEIPSTSIPQPENEAEQINKIETEEPNKTEIPIIQKV